jgi:hypothetical protein
MGMTSGAAAPSASAAHGDVGRCTSRQIARTPSITPERTAGAGSPITAMYAAVITSVAMLAVAGLSRAMRQMSSTAIAMIATCNPEMESMCTIPDTANRSRTAGSTARSSAMRRARTRGASLRKSVSMRAPIAARATSSGSRRPRE